jgi:2-dehydropantoate 2-reductase
MRVVVFGAGAVGGVLGGMLALRNHAVLLLCRKDHANAIQEQKGLRIRSATGDYFASLDAVTKLEPVHFGPDTCVFFTVKSNDTQSAVEELLQVAGSDVPLITFQNGVSNEEELSKKCTRVYGGVCRMTCSFLHPGQVAFRKMGGLVVGKYPKGTDAFSKKLADVLSDAGFETIVSKSIMCDKWLKLAVNLQSGFNAIIDPRDHNTAEFIGLKTGLLEEAKQVLDADKIKAKSCVGSDLSLDELIEDLKKPHSPRGSSFVKVNNSTWQSLYLRRDSIENGYFHGPLIDMAKKHKIRVPYNEIAFEKVKTCCSKKIGPGMLRAGEILDEIKRRGQEN